MDDLMLVSHMEKSSLVVAIYDLSSGLVERALLLSHDAGADITLQPGPSPSAIMERN